MSSRCLPGVHLPDIYVYAPVFRMAVSLKKRNAKEGELLWLNPARTGSRAGADGCAGPDYGGAGRFPRGHEMLGESRKKRPRQRFTDEVWPGVKRDNRN